MTLPVTDDFLDELVTGSQAEGITCLGVVAAIEHQDCTLLIAGADDDFEPSWQLPTDLVLPAESLLDGLHRSVTAITGLDVIDVTGYVGHHDRLVGGEVVRLFLFAVTTSDPERIWRQGNMSHRWTSDPITACGVF